MKSKLLFFYIIIFFSVLAGCEINSSSANDKTVKIGVSGAEGPVWDLFVDKAKEEGIDVEIVEIVDWQLPNDSLVNGEIDMNAFQHLAFLSQYNVQKGADIVPIASAFVGPKGLFSEKYKSVEEIPNGVKVAISNDPANMGLDLSLLEAVGLIELNDEVGIFGTPEDIIENPKNLEISAMNAQQTPRALQDVALSAIYTNMAAKAGISMDKLVYENDPLSIEGLPYVCVFAVNPEDKDNETYKKVASIFQDPEIKEAYKEDNLGQGEVVDIPVEDLQNTLDDLMQ